MIYYLTYRRDWADKVNRTSLSSRIGALAAPKTLRLGGSNFYQGRPVTADVTFLRDHKATLLPLLTHRALVIKDEIGRTMSIETFNTLTLEVTTPVVDVPVVEIPVVITQPVETPDPVVEEPVVDEKPLAEMPTIVDPPVAEEPEPEVPEEVPADIEATVDVVEGAAPVPEIEPVPDAEAAPVVAELPDEKPVKDKPSHMTKMTREELEALPFNQLRDVVKHHGLQAKGSRKELIDRILDLQQ